MNYLYQRFHASVIRVTANPWRKSFVILIFMVCKQIGTNSFLRYWIKCYRLYSIRVGFGLTAPDRISDTPSLLYNGQRGGWGVKLTIHIHLVPRIGMRGTQLSTGQLHLYLYFTELIISLLLLIRHCYIVHLGTNRQTVSIYFTWWKMERICSKNGKPQIYSKSWL